MERKDTIQNAYRLTGSNNFYDGMITCSTASGKAVCRAVWGMNKTECDEYLTHALSGIPTDFSGRLLEVPVGTGVLTMPLYQTLPGADITCLDYSPDMMAQAQEKANRLGLTNVRFQQGDVGALPFDDGSFDTVLSLNGFHAFPDKEAAYKETFRVLKPGGTIIFCEAENAPSLVTRRTEEEIFGGKTEPPLAASFLWSVGQKRLEPSECSSPVDCCPQGRAPAAPCYLICLERVKGVLALWLLLLWERCDKMETI